MRPLRSHIRELQTRRIQTAIHHRERAFLNHYLERLFGISKGTDGYLTLTRGEHHFLWCCAQISVYGHLRVFRHTAHANSAALLGTKPRTYTQSCAAQRAHFPRIAHAAYSTTPPDAPRALHRAAVRQGTGCTRGITPAGNTLAGRAYLVYSWSQQSWGISSAGRAFGSQSRGQGFDSPILHSPFSGRCHARVRAGAGCRPALL